MDALWQTNLSLGSAARVRLGRSALLGDKAAELACLLTLGVVAAMATTLVPGGFRLPGHAILRGTLPLILGISLVPRRTAGTVMSFAAAATFGALRLGGTGLPNPAAWVGLLCLGPAADVALTGARPGWMLYLRFAAAGLIANLAAFAARMATGPVALAGAGRNPSRVVTWAPGSGMGGGNRMGGGGGRGMHAPAIVEQFWPTALLSFAIFGAVAGLVCAIIWFRTRPRSANEGSAT
jgi:hypothetical protein